MKFGNKTLLISTIFGLFLVLAQSVYGYTVPAYVGFVNDFAKVMTKEGADRIEELLVEQASQDDGLEIVVVTTNSLDMEPIEDVAQNIFDEWKIGKSNIDNGVLILIAIEERAVRIHTGYGAEVFLNDATAGRIIREQMNPYLRDGNYDMAISNAVESVIVAGEKQVVAAKNESPVGFEELFWQLIQVPTLLVFFGAIMTYLIAFLGRSKEWWPGGVIGGVVGWFIATWSGLIGFGILGLILDYILSKNYKRWKLEHRTTSWRRTWGGFRGGKPPIKFGGGISGGGGATGRW